MDSLGFVEPKRMAIIRGIIVVLVVPMLMAQETDLQTELRKHAREEGWAVGEVTWTGIQVIPIDGTPAKGPRRPLKVQPQAGRLSADGRHFAAMVDVDENPHFAVMSLDGSVETVFQRNIIAEDCVALSPDHKAVVFNGIYKPPGTGEVNTHSNRSRWIFGLQYAVFSTGEVVPLRVTKGPKPNAPYGIISPPCESIGWSSEGSSIVYQAGDEIRIHDLHRRQSRFLDRGNSPTWSPHGRWIAYRSPEGKAILATPDGRSKNVLIGGRTVLGPLQWSPDSRLLLFGEKRPNPSGSLMQPWLVVLRLEDSATAPISPLFEGGNRDYGWVVFGAEGGRK